MSATDYRVNAAILAGGSSGDGVATATGAPCKALVEAEGRPLIAWVLDALRDAETVGNIVAVEGPDRPISFSDGLRPDVPIVAAGGARFLDTLSAAVGARADDERVLVVSADLPLLTSEAVDGFVRSCQETQGELSYPIVQAEAFEEAFPGRSKTVAPLREGRFTGGNLAIVTRRFVLEQGTAIARTFDRRKSTIGLAWMFGLRFVARLLLGTLSVSDLERRGGEMLGTTLAAVQVPWPEIGFDVDHPEDLELASHFLRERMARR